MRQTMTESNPSGSIDIAEICAQELARHQWSLAAEPSLLPAGGTFAQVVAAHVADQCNREQRPLDEALVRRAVVHIYCHLLHRALSTNGTRVQGMALQETINYGWPVALQRCRDRAFAESAILHAVNKLWLNVEKCEPGSYLAYFTTILLREIGQQWRTAGRIGNAETTEADLQRAESALNESDDIDGAALEQFSDAANPYHEVELAASRTKLFELLRDCLNNARRVHIIIGRYYAELNPLEIAQNLAIKVEQVYVEHHRAIERIKKCCRNRYWLNFSYC
jgi:RNA polymerase sigma factor (sigma-70 family)